MAKIRLDLFDNSDFDRGASRWREIFWIFARAIFFMTNLPYPSSWRVAILRFFGAKVGDGVVIRGRVFISFPWRCEIGDFVWLGEEVHILSLAKVVIGAHCCISQRAFLCTGSHDFSAEKFDLITKPIEIADHCWIAANAFISPGTTIGENTCIRANTLAKGKIPANSTV